MHHYHQRQSIEVKEETRRERKKNVKCNFDGKFCRMQFFPLLLVQSEEKLQRNKNKVDLITFVIEHKR